MRSWVQISTRRPLWSMWCINEYPMTYSLLREVLSVRDLLISIPQHGWIYTCAKQVTSGLTGIKQSVLTVTVISIYFPVFTIPFWLGPVLQKLQCSEINPLIIALHLSHRAHSLNERIIMQSDMVKWWFTQCFHANNNPVHQCWQWVYVTHTANMLGVLTMWNTIQPKSSPQHHPKAEST